MRRSTFLAAATATALSDADGWYEPGLIFVTAQSTSPIGHITAHL